MSVRPSQKFRDQRRISGPLPHVPVLAWTAADEMKTKRFLDACKAQDVEPTRRQARAYLARRGRWAKLFNNRIIEPVAAAS